MEQVEESEGMDRVSKGEGEWIKKEVLTAEELALYLGFNKNWIYRKAEAGELPGTKLGRSWRFKRSVIDRWLEERIERGMPIPLKPRGRAEEKVVGAEEDLPPEATELLERVFKVIEAHPEGVTLQEIGDEIGLEWRRLTSFANRLMKEGKARKEGREYFPAGPRG